jgi:hypothetical protein
VRLGRAECDGMRANVRDAIDTLHREIREPHQGLVRAAGLPTAIEQERLLFQLETRIWS